MNLVGICLAAATVGVLTAVVSSAAPRWTAEAQNRAEIVELQMVLRDAQQRAVAEGRPTCVPFATSGATWHARPGPCGTDVEGVTFFPDGSATPGTFRLSTASLTVEPQSGRFFTR